MSSDDLTAPATTEKDLAERSSLHDWTVRGLTKALDQRQWEPVPPADDGAEAHLAEFLTVLAIWRAALSGSRCTLFADLSDVQDWRTRHYSLPKRRLRLTADYLSAEQQAQLAGWVRFAEEYRRAIRQASST